MCWSNISACCFIKSFPFSHFLSFLCLVCYISSPSVSLCRPFRLFTCTLLSLSSIFYLPSCVSFLLLILPVCYSSCCFQPFRTSFFLASFNLLSSQFSLCSSFLFTYSLFASQSPCFLLLIFSPSPLLVTICWGGLWPFNYGMISQGSGHPASPPPPPRRHCGLGEAVHPAEVRGCEINDSPDSSPSAEDAASGVQSLFFGLWCYGGGGHPGCRSVNAALKAERAAFPAELSSSRCSLPAVLQWWRVTWSFCSSHCRWIILFN